MLYNDYLRIDQDFVPVFSRENDTGERWKSFIPHDSIRKVLQNLIYALNGANGSDRKALWMTGSYGTGKTYAAFLIKHLLEDPIAEITQWFEKYPEVQTLLDQFVALRQNKRIIVPVFRSSAGMVTNDLRLFMEIQTGIEECLKAKEYHDMGASSLRELILQELLGAMSTFNFDVAIKKHEKDFGVGETAEHIRKTLKEQPDNNELLAKVMLVMEQEGYYLLRSVEDIKKWIRTVIQTNKIDAIVFIWDEFTNYFYNNSDTGSLQELAHLSADTNFFLFLITHRDLQQYSTINSDNQKVLSNRFYIENLKMSNVTSYHLLANAIIPLKEKACEWKTRCLTMWEDVRVVFNTMVDTLPGTSFSEDQFLALTPMHPYTALMLSELSTYGASQRTMFSFLRGDLKGTAQQNFAWYIKNVPAEKWPWLTPDYLWNYFFGEIGKDTDPSAVERINHYMNYCEKMDPDELRVFKVVMLLLILEVKAKGNKMFRPLVKNVTLAFSGTKIKGQASALILQIAQKGAINLTGSDADQVFTMPMMSIDHDELERMKKQISQEYSFDRCLNVGNAIATQMTELYSSNMPNHFALRFTVRCCSANGSSAGNALLDLQNKIKTAANLIGVLFLFANADEDVAKINEFILSKSSLESNDRIVFINTADPLTPARWEDWVDNRARQEYAKKQNNVQNAKFYQDKAEDILVTWRKRIQVSKLYAAFRGEQQLCSDVIAYLNIVVKQVYSYGQEQLEINDNGYKAGAEGAVRTGLGLSSGGFGQLAPLVERLQNDHFWDNPDAMKQPGLHPLCKAYATINDLIFQKLPQPTYIQEIWRSMQNPPLGYLNCTASYFLLGFILSPYTKGEYYFDDGSNTRPLNSDNLTKALTEVIKEKSGSGNYKIMQMKPEHIKLCQAFKKIFDLSDEQTTTLQEAKKCIRTFVNQIKYPLWVLTQCNEFSAMKNTQALTDAIIQITRFLSVIDENSEYQIADSLYETITKNRLTTPLKELISIGNFIDGMDRYLAYALPKTSEYQKALGKNNADIREIAKLRTADSGCWLWEREKFAEEMESLEKETGLVQVLNTLLADKASTLKQAQANIRSMFECYRLPFVVLEKCSSQNIKLFQRLYNHIVNGKFEVPDQFALELLPQINSIHTLFTEEAEILMQYIKESVGSNISIDLIQEQVLPQLQQGELMRDLQMFNARLQPILSKMKNVQLFDKLQRLWFECTGSKDPIEWSMKTSTPILWMPDASNPVFCEIINQLTTTHREYLKGNELEQSCITFDNEFETWKAHLNSSSVCDKALQDHVCGNYLHMIGTYVTLQDIRRALKEIGSSPFRWSSSSSDAVRIVQKLVEKQYVSSASPAVIRKVETMTPDEAKAYLVDLLMKNPTVGIAMLQDS